MAKKLCLGCMCEFDDKLNICPECSYVVGTKAKETYHLSPGTVIGEKYIVGKAIGFGGFGITYIGYNFALSKKVAIKEYLPNEFATRCEGENTVTVFTNVEKEEQYESGLNKFIDEAKRLAKYSDVPNVVTIFDSFIENNTAYIVMEYLEGETLSEKLRKEKTISCDEALNYMIPVLESLEVLHKDDMIHRDIAPDNIFITNDNKVKLIDFGAARYATSTHSKSLSVIIKEGYAPPEQYRSKGDQGPWTDVYACAATLYRMITGVKPEESINRMEKDTLVKPSKLGVDISKNIEIALMNALNLKIEDRTESAERFKNELLSEDKVTIRKNTLKKLDIGQWPLWFKVSSSLAAAAIVLVSVLMATGVISVNPVEWVAGIGKSRVPLVVNTDLAYAEEKISGSNMIMQITDKVYSDETPKDLILAQSIEDGTIIDNEGVVLEVVVSAGGETIYMPDFVGIKKEEAFKELKGSGVYYQETEKKESEIAPECIIEQDIKPGKETEKGSNVRFVISSGNNSYDKTKYTTVPDLVDISWADGRKAIAEKKLYIFIEKREYNDTVPEGMVISQSIEKGKKVKEGTEVGVVVSLGITKYRVPDVQYKDYSDAKTLLGDAKLNVTVEWEDSKTVAKDKVIRQSIEPGTEVEAGTAITIYVSKGNPDIKETTEDRTTGPVADESGNDNSSGGNNQQTEAKNTKTNQDQSKKPEADQKPKETNTTSGKPAGNDNKTNTDEGKVTVPSVVGMDFASAKATIESFGLKCAQGSMYSSPGRSDNSVLRQSITAGSKTDKNSTVILDVCSNQLEYRYFRKTKNKVWVDTETKITSPSDPPPESEGWRLSSTGVDEDGNDFYIWNRDIFDYTEVEEEVSEAEYIGGVNNISDTVSYYKKEIGYRYPSF
ncbi:MAG: PASTA domain-containing protein [Eubacterium sp.]|nr:PASTA domain-containing protein [Eubacterium sp.]